MYLFLDTSAFIQVGLLDEEFNWVHHEIVQNRKGSQVLHSVIFQALEEENIKISSLQGLFLANGPGSYTGVRVGEGFSQILELEGIPVYSFYHYEVPLFLGIDNYSFFSEAFKKEVFFFEYKNKNEEKRLISEKEFLSLDLSMENTFHLEGNILGRDIDSLYDLFKKSSNKIFKCVRERSEHLPPYYYRSLEKEFNRAK